MAKPRDYKAEYANYQGKPEQIKNRAERNAARAQLEKAGKVRKGDGMVPKSANRSYARNSDGSIKGK